MTTKQAHALNIGSKITHKRYGICTVRKVMFTSDDKFFGICINPDSKIGIELMNRDAGVYKTHPLMECSLRQVQVFVPPKEGQLKDITV